VSTVDKSAEISDPGEVPLQLNKNKKAMMKINPAVKTLFFLLHFT
jgi:hypothetical protein